VRRFTIITIIVILLALVAVAIQQLSLGLTVEERNRPPATPSPSWG
jgi:hypothetical protein